MKITTIIGALTLGCIITSIIALPSVAAIMAIASVILAFILIMAVIINLGNPFIVSRYVIHKGWHYSIQSVLTFLFPFVRSFKGYGITAIINNYSDNKYDNTDGSCNKFFGLSFGWNPHKNSMRFASRHLCTDYYECCWYYYRDGNRYESKPFVLEYGKDYELVITNCVARVTITDDDSRLLRSNISLFTYYDANFDDNSRKWILMPYFGGKKRSPKKMIFKVEIEDDNLQ